MPKYPNITNSIKNHKKIMNTPIDDIHDNYIDRKNNQEEKGFWAVAQKR